MQRFLQYHRFLLISLVLVFMGAPVALGGTIYVDDDAPIGGDGLAWASAHKYLQDGLAAATLGDEIRVAGGVYKPDQDEAGNVIPGDREATFQLIDGVAMYGGYAGCGQLDPDARDIVAYRTILSGDLNGDDGPGFANNDENSNHVVTGRYIGQTTVIGGLTITGGNADSYTEWQGGGVYNVFRSSPTLINCTLRGNSAHSSGGGMESYASDPILINCTFSGNRTTAGIPTLGFGGGMRNARSSPVLINCAFSGNSANAGGAVLNTIECNVRLTNCTFAANAADYGRAMACDSPYHASTVQMSNCILWDGGDEVWINDNSTITITHSNVQGGWPGDGNIDLDPLFAEADGPDGVPGTQDHDLRLASSSPCIDAGDNTAVPADSADLDGDGDTAERTPLDLDGNPRFMDGLSVADTGLPDLPEYPEIVDMGAYEHQVIFTWLDIKPGACPNPLNRRSHGVVPVAVVGTEFFDVTEIDVSTVRLSRADGVGGAVAPNEGPPGPHSVIDDVATPFGNPACECHDLEGDGIDDLVMKFRTEDVVEILELYDLISGDELELVVSGLLLDGGEFTTHGDCILIVR